MTLLEMCASLIFGGGVYIIIEILYRGYSHWSMAIAGGVSFLLLHGLFSKFSGMHMILKLVACLIIISSVEFLVGYIVNMRFRWNIWDYSNHRYNLSGVSSLFIDLGAVRNSNIIDQPYMGYAVLTYRMAAIYDSHMFFSPVASL